MIHRSAVLHIPLSNYAYPEDEHTLTIRLRCQKGDLTSCILYYGDRASMNSPVDFTSVFMKAAGHDGLFDYYEAVLENCYSRVCYYFRLEQSDSWIYYYGDDFHKALPDVVQDGVVIEARSEYYQYPYILRTEIPEMPEWFLHAVVYNIFPDSFASDYRAINIEDREEKLSDGKIIQSCRGGNIRGIHENLDYIQSLGFNCIYLNPIFTAGEYHKYDIMDYYKIDPGMGTEAEFQALVDEVHRRDMHIIIDGVFNHCSWYFFAFEDVVNNGQESQYCEWFYHLEFPVERPQKGEIPGYACFAYEPKMPKLNTANEQVQNYFARVGAYWISKYQVDGWRLDVANEVDRNFWRKFRSAVKEVDSQAVLIGEVWENSETWLKGDAFDSTMNYDFRKHCRSFFGNKEINAEEFENRMTSMRYRYPRKITLGQLNLLDTHDVPRFLSLCKEDKERWKQAFLYLMMAPGVPSVFYGDEQGLTGIREPEYRQAMPWESRDKELEAFVRQAISIRKQWVDPEDGYERLELDEYPNVVFFARKNEKYDIFCCLNAGEVDCRLGELSKGEMLMGEDVEGNAIRPGGFCIVKRQNEADRK